MEMDQGYEIMNGKGIQDKGRIGRVPFKRVQLPRSLWRSFYRLMRVVYHSRKMHVYLDHETIRLCTQYSAVRVGLICILEYTDQFFCFLSIKNKIKVTYYFVGLSESQSAPQRLNLTILNVLDQWCLLSIMAIWFFVQLGPTQVLYENI